ncbi:MAG: ArsR family transcriptional regulator [Clostridia bacterium]|nr:ArsR family transcriptional regulator [Clostridia bacterium]
MQQRGIDLPFMQYRHSCLCEEDTETMVARCRALSSVERVKIIRMLHQNSMTVTEVAKALYMSVSTATFHLHILRDAGLIDIVLMPGKRGHVQLCQNRFSSLFITVLPQDRADNASVVVQDIPVGLYTGAGMEFVSGFCTADEQIMFDDGNYFSARRAEAQLIWASGGYVEYSVSNMHKDRKLKRISLSLEICSETMNYQHGWKSDITFWLNGRELCTFTSPSDFGGRRGRLNPAWWPDTSTQFGELKEITVNEAGCFLNGSPAVGISSPAISDFDGTDTFVFRIGNKPDAKYKGGFNIFGKGFGDHMQDIRVEAEYENDGAYS